MEDIETKAKRQWKMPRALSEHIKKRLFNPRSDGALEVLRNDVKRLGFVISLMKSKWNKSKCCGSGRGFR